MLARRLEAHGVSVARRWRYLIAGAGCEGGAHALADQVRGYSSACTRIRVQPGIYDVPPVRVWVERLARRGALDFGLMPAPCGDA
jgi:hypothetical protein